MIAQVIFVLFLGIVHAERVKFGLDFLGRFRDVNGAQRAEWPGSAVRFSFTSPSSVNEAAVNVSFSGCSGSCKYYVAVFLDCEEVDKFAISEAQPWLHYTFSSSGPTTKRELSFVKITESSNGEAVGFMEVSGVDVQNIHVSPFFTSQCATSGKKILFLGDSLTAAYGVDGVSPCDFTAETEDVAHGYAGIVARNLKADWHTVAWSGRGVVRNYADPSQMSACPMPGYYNRTLATICVNDDAANYWNPSRYVPDVVTIMLGQNDYSTAPQPTDEQFTNGYVDFIRQIQTDYPKAKVLAMCSPSPPWPTQCSNIETAASLTDSHYLTIPSSVYSGGQGCAGHPNQATQQLMAEAVQPTVESLLFTR